MTILLSYNPDQERDETGRFAPSGEAAAAALDEAGLNSGPRPPDVPARPAYVPAHDDHLSSPEFAGLPLDEIIQAGRGTEHEAGDPMLAAIWHARGFDGPPTVVSPAEFDKARGDAPVLYRGIAPPETGRPGSAEQWAEEFRTGPAFPGRGGYGAGTYVSDDPNSTGLHSRGVHLDGERQGEGAVLRMALREDARVTSLREIADRQDAWKAAWIDRMKAVEGDERATLMARANRERTITDDPGRMAAVLGYQAIRVQNVSPGKDYVEDYYSIQDRTAVIVEDAPK